MTILTEPMSRDALRTMAAHYFDDLIKGVVDVSRGLLALDAEMHADLESLLLDDGSEQADLWGINLYPDLESDDFVEFDSMINLRPAVGNRSRGVDDPEIRRKIMEVVRKWCPE